tara:strand:+ start:1770 stop:2327 length:558 start_codon:yes stop_codon:yes gene_type:complete
MSLDKLTSQLNQSKQDKEKKLPPVESWNPPYCGEIDIKIKVNGDWFHEGTAFKRMNLVKLFATVLWREVSENTDEYFLVTPVEKIKISVEDAPFVLTQWRWQDEKKQTMVLSTNLDEEFILGKEHPISLNDQGELYVLVRRNLLAKVHRNVYYQWIDLAEEISTGETTQLVLNSAGNQFVLGSIT